VLYPKLYVEIESLVRDRTPQREEFVQQVIDAVNEDLKADKIKGSVVGRPKQYYSIYQKMVLRGPRVRRDLRPGRHPRARQQHPRLLRGARVDPRPLEPDPGRFKDYIATPKFNLYQSLHTTVIGPKGRAVEIQIRTHEMHQRAEFGVAAHWKYKERIASGRAEDAKQSNDTRWPGSPTSATGRRDRRPGGVPRQSALRDRCEGGLRLHARRARSSAFPPAAPPVDFAYAVHTEVGHRTMGAKVNGRLVPLESALVSGDVVEVFTSKNPDCRPEPGLADFVKSPRARNKIRGGSPRSAARRRSSRARTRSPARCASRTCRCRSS
jgi:GTP pyrophosphokinase